VQGNPSRELHVLESRIPGHRWKKAQDTSKTVTFCHPSSVKLLTTVGQAGREHWIGARVSLYWSSYDKWFEGVVVDYDNAKNKYKVKYDDGDLLWETYDDGFNIVTLPGGANNKNKKVKYINPEAITN
jgi:hypothetical protein